MRSVVFSTCLCLADDCLHRVIKCKVIKRPSGLDPPVAKAPSDHLAPFWLLTPSLSHCLMHFGPSGALLADQLLPGHPDPSWLLVAPITTSRIPCCSGISRQIGVLAAALRPLGCPMPSWLLGAGRIFYRLDSLSIPARTFSWPNGALRLLGFISPPRLVSAFLIVQCPAPGCLVSSS